MAFIKLIMFIMALYGMAAVMSPATTSGRVGFTLDWASSFCHVRLPSSMSPKRCTIICPAPSILVSSPTF